jgi:hypothetical protein
VWRNSTHRGGALTFLMLARRSCSAAPQPSAAWIPNGNPICALANTQSHASLAPDGTGGFYVAWLDERTANPAVYLMRVQGDGSIPAPWPANGIKISPLGNVDGGPGIVPDGSGGVLVFWKHTGLYGKVIGFQRVNDQAGISQPDGGATLMADWTASPFAVTSDGAGGAYVSWIRAGGRDAPGGRGHARECAGRVRRFRSPRAAFPSSRSSPVQLPERDPDEPGSEWRGRRPRAMGLRRPLRSPLRRGRARDAGCERRIFRSGCTRRHVFERNHVRRPGVACSPGGTPTASM